MTHQHDRFMHVLATAVAFVATNAMSSGARGAVVAEWRMDEGTGTVAYDSSGNGHHANLYEGFTPAANWIPGVSGTALRFDGRTEYGDAGRALLGGKRFELLTLDAWVRTSGVPAGYNNGWDFAFALGNETTDGEFQMGMTRAGLAYVDVRVANGVHAQLHGPSILRANPNILDDPGDWHHLVFVKSSELASFYVDDVLVDFVETSGLLAMGGNWRVALGSKYTNQPKHYWPGDIDEVRISDVPEPATGILLGAASLALLRRPRRLRKALRQQHCGA